MNCKFTNVLMFAAGAAIGSAVTWKYLKTKYEQLVQEEIESIKEAFADKVDYSQAAEESEESEECENHIDWDELEDLDEEDEDEDEESDDGMNDYAKLIDQYSNEKGGAEKMAARPYVISPYDFGELDGYSQVELTYYADGTLEDEDREIVTDVDELIGSDSLLTFGEYEDDAVFVRNERLRVDFQILKDYRTYEEARSIAPKQVDDE